MSTGRNNSYCILSVYEMWSMLDLGLTWIIFFSFSKNPTIYIQSPRSFYNRKSWSSKGHIKHWSGIWTLVVSTPQSESLITRRCWWNSSWLCVLRGCSSTKLQTTEQLLGGTNLADSVKDILYLVWRVHEKREKWKAGRWGGVSFFGEREEAGWQMK